MKKYFYLTTLIFAFFACSKPVEDHGIPSVGTPVTTPPVKDATGSIALFNKSKEFVIYLSGKNVTVHSGDGHARYYASPDSTIAITKIYTSSIHDPLIITGTNITYLKCSGNNLLSLDVSNNPALIRLDCSNNSLDTLDLQKNTALKYLNCRNNNFSQPALDKLFTTLHSNAQPKDSVLFFNNPGAANTSGSIATAKGWSIDKVSINKSYSLSFGANSTATKIGLTGSNIVIDWGDGSSDTYASLSYSTPITHNYSQAQKHWVKVGGDVITHLNSSNTGITNLDVTAATGLTYLDCSMSDQYTLDVTNNTALTYLKCSDARLSGLDISKNTLLTYLDCSSGTLANVINNLDCTNNPLLKYLNCSISQVVTLDVSKNAALTELNCSNNINLATLDLSGNPALESLRCVFTSLSALNVSANHKLSTLDCAYSKIATLDVSNNPAIKQLTCSSNQLTALDLTSCAALEYLNCQNNSIAALDVSKCSGLTLFSCSNNKLTALDLSNNTDITGIWCDQNQLSATALNNMFTSLRILTPAKYGTISQKLNPGSGSCDRSIATNKWWTIQD